jgi:hypothetical protein
MKNQKLSKFQKQHLKYLKTLSKKELIKKSMVDLELSANMMIANDNLRAELHATKKILDTTEQAIVSAEHALHYKEGEINHKDRLLNSLINS